MTPISLPAAPPPAQQAGPKNAQQAAEEAKSNQEMFLKLLVAQLQNQNPADPSDPIQFVTQLAQFSGLEQSIAIRKEIEAMRGLLEAQSLAGAQTPVDAMESIEV
jgi:flagellar basal-body rod modification protein FlgD